MLELAIQLFDAVHSLDSNHYGVMRIGIEFLNAYLSTFRRLELIFALMHCCSEEKNVSISIGAAFINFKYRIII
jgi:hypothetical protein